jgi:selenophosphate synthetase-related protein
MPLKHLGYKAVVVNISDICAMNAKPTQITVSIAVSNRFPLEALDELFAGITHALEYNVDVVVTRPHLKRINYSITTCVKRMKMKSFIETVPNKLIYCSYRRYRRCIHGITSFRKNKFFR